MKYDFSLVKARLLSAVSMVAVTVAVTRAAESATNDYWAVEDRAAREQLPLYTNIPAATKESKR